MASRSIEIEDKIDKLATKIIVPLRHKVVDEDAFNELFDILEEVSSTIQDEQFISRKLAGLLFFIYSKMMVQVNYAENKEPIFIQLAKLQSYIRKILIITP